MLLCYTPYIHNSTFYLMHHSFNHLINKKYIFSLLLWYISREIFTSANYIQFQDVTGGWFLQKRGWGWIFFKLICVSKHRHFLFVTNFVLTPKHQPPPLLHYPYLIFWCFKKGFKGFPVVFKIKSNKKPFRDTIQHKGA